MPGTVTPGTVRPDVAPRGRGLSKNEEGDLRVKNVALMPAPAGVVSIPAADGPDGRRSSEVGLVLEVQGCRTSRD